MYNQFSKNFKALRKVHELTQEQVAEMLGDRPQTTAKSIRATNGRPYKRISAENLFSLPICVIMGLHRRAGACSRRNVNIPR